MELKNKLFAVLAIFCVIFSACAVCAADDVMGLNETNDNTTNDYPYDEVVVDETGMNDVFDGTLRSFNETSAPDANDTAQNQTDANSTDNATVPAAGGEVSNATNATVSHGLPSTGNPILALLAICAVLGGTTIYKRK